LVLDPLSILPNARFGQFLYQSGDYNAALDQLRSTLELDANWSIVHLQPRVGLRRPASSPSTYGNTVRR
jgi:lipoprotein NlpI